MVWQRIGVGLCAGRGGNGRQEAILRTDAIEIRARR